MLTLLAALALQAAPADAGAFLKRFDELVRGRKNAEAAKYYEAHRERFKDDPALAKESGRLEAAYDDARGAPFRKTKLKIDFAAGAPGTEVSGPAKLATGPDGQALDLTTTQSFTPGTLLKLPAGTAFSPGAAAWLDVDVYYEGPAGVSFSFDLIGKRGAGIARSRLEVGGLAPGAWKRKTFSFAAFALGAWPDQEALGARDGEVFHQIGLIPPQKVVGRLLLRAIHVYDEDKHETLKLEPNAADPGGLTRLHRAALAGDVKKIKDLLAKGAPSKGGLVLAAGNGHTAAVEALLAVSADGSGPALLAAARAVSLKTVKVLLAAEADPNARDARSRTALHYACERDVDRAQDQLTLVRLLLAAGADPRAQDELKKTPADLAAKSEFKEAADLLKKAR